MNAAFFHSPHMKAAETILKKEKIIRIGNRNISCKPITLATFVAVSEIVSCFPQISEELQRTNDEILSFVLTDAKKYEGLADMIAILVLGQPRKDSILKRWKRRRLSNYIADKVPAYELGTILNQLLDSVSIAHFFQCTASLSELNLLKEKRKMDRYGDK